MEKVITKRRLHERESAYTYWKDKSMIERLEAIEELRRQYIEAQGITDQRVQRVCWVVRRGRR